MAGTVGKLRPMLVASAVAATAILAQPSGAADYAASAPLSTGDQRFGAALAALQPQRPGVVDAYVVVAALDTDAVFSREARETGRVLARRFDAEGRTLVLAQDDGGDLAAAAGTPTHLVQALARAASLMDSKEDVLVLYTTSHGMPRAGLKHKDLSGGEAIITPPQLAAMLAPFRNRLVILQACFSGQFVPVLASPNTIVATAASSTHSSFGCTPDNDWTFFGHALVNQAMRKPETFTRQFRRAFVSILGWEQKLGIKSSNPQLSVGSSAAVWLAALEARAPTAESAPVGRPPSELGN